MSQLSDVQPIASTRGVPAANTTDAPASVTSGTEDASAGVAATVTGQSVNAQEHVQPFAMQKRRKRRNAEEEDPTVAVMQGAVMQGAVQAMAAGETVPDAHDDCAKNCGTTAERLMVKEFLSEPKSAFITCCLRHALVKCCFESTRVRTQYWYAVSMLSTALVTTAYSILYGAAGCYLASNCV